MRTIEKEAFDYTYTLDELKETAVRIKIKNQISRCCAV